MTAVLEAICVARDPRTALNWLRDGAGAAILADVAAGRTATQDALDAHPRPRAAGYLRQVLVAGGVLPARDEELARARHWPDGLLQAITDPQHRRLVRAFATWHVMRWLRRAAAARCAAKNANMLPAGTSCPTAASSNPPSIRSKPCMPKSSQTPAWPARHATGSLAIQQAPSLTAKGPLDLHSRPPNSSATHFSCDVTPGRPVAVRSSCP